MKIGRDNDTQRGVRRSGGNYVENKLLLEEIKKSQQAKEPTVSLCLMVRSIVAGVLQHRCFNRYPKAFKDEMASESFFRILRGLLNTYDVAKPNAFGYVSHSCFINFFQQIMKRYKRMEREQLAEDPLVMAALAKESTGLKMNGNPLANGGMT